ncbi:MAG: DUF262 domain-containing protein [Polyangiaceae bacterium]|nr:DUF262 domain-containing protein [Polyangiaceae bacterium]
MSESPITQPNATALHIEDLVAYVREGRVRVPAFQRPLRWQWEDVRRLFDSILRGYPIGSLLLWERPAPAKTIQLGAMEITARATSNALWVVDGQQRITSLANALSDEGSKDQKFSLHYNLQEQKLGRPRSDEPLSLPLPVVFDLQRLLKWFADHLEATEYLDEATRVAKLIRQYTVPAYIVKQEDEKVLQDIFDRMNNYGRKLTRAEVFSALHAGTQGGPPRNLRDLAQKVEARVGFGVVDENTVLHALLACRGPDVTREIRIEFLEGRSQEFPNDTQEDAYLRAEEALVRAVGFMQCEAHVPHFGFLPYRYLLVVLTRFFAHHPDPAPRNRELLRRWFWRAALLGPTIARGVYTSAMKNLASCVIPKNESGSVQKLLAVVDTHHNSAAAFTFPRRFGSKTAEVRFVLCAMWELSPRSARTGEPYDRTTLSNALVDQATASEALELCFPRVPGVRREMANRIFWLGEGEEEDCAPHESLGERPPSMTKKTWQDVLTSHALDSELTELLRDGDHKHFFEKRSLRMAQITEAFLERMTESSFENTPPLEDLDLDTDEDEDNDVETHESF